MRIALAIYLRNRIVFVAHLGFVSSQILRQDVSRMGRCEGAKICLYMDIPALKIEFGKQSKI